MAAALALLMPRSLCRRRLWINQNSDSCPPDYIYATRVQLQFTTSNKTRCSDIESAQCSGISACSIVQPKCGLDMLGLVLKETFSNPQSTQSLFFMDDLEARMPLCNYPTTNARNEKTFQYGGVRGSPIFSMLVHSDPLKEITNSLETALGKRGKVRKMCGKIWQNGLSISTRRLIQLHN